MPFNNGFEVAFMGFWFLSVILGVGGAIVLLISIWRLMKAHESLAAAVQEIAETMKQVK